MEIVNHNTREFTIVRRKKSLTNWINFTPPKKESLDYLNKNLGFKLNVFSYGTVWMFETHILASWNIFWNIKKFSTIV